MCLGARFGERFRLLFGNSDSTGCGAESNTNIMSDDVSRSTGRVVLARTRFGGGSGEVRFPAQGIGNVRMAATGSRHDSREPHSGGMDCWGLLGTAGTVYTHCHTLPCQCAGCSHA